jgi:hypothetical protein
LFSPLYVGFFALALAGVALWRRVPGAWFWGIAALAALVWSLGANSPFYPLLYNTLPGLRFFRGQERAAYLWVGAVAILAGLGVTALPLLNHTLAARALRRALWALAAFALLVVAFAFSGWLGAPETYAQALPAVVFGGSMVIAAALLLPWLAQRPRQRWWFALIPALAAFELFVVSMDADATYAPIPPGDQIAMTAAGNPLLEPILNDDGPFRVDGQRGLTDNYGSLWGIQDIHGISPLFLADVRALIDGGVDRGRLWEIMAVRYVLSDWAELPVPAQVVAAGEDRYGPVNAHALEDPRPFALLMEAYRTTETWSIPIELLNDPAVNLRETVLLDAGPGLDAPLGAGTAEVLRFAPERVDIAVSADAPALLSVALVDYPGWQATIDGAPADILRAYTAFSAVVVPAGQHTVTFTFAPASVALGAAISLAAWLGTLALTGARFALHWRRHG